MRAARERAELSREALAFHSGLSWAAIASLESGRRTQTRPVTLLALARALDVTIDYLVQGEGRPVAMLRHQLLSYSSEDEFLATSRPFIAEGAARSEALLVVTTEANIRRLEAQLGAAAGDTEFIESSGWYEKPASTVAGYRKFIVDKVDQGASWVRILGEPIWTNRPSTELDQWLDYESVLNLTFSSLPVTLRCFLDERSVEPSVAKRVREAHPEVVSGGDAVPNSLFRDPVDFLLDR